MEIYTFLARAPQTQYTYGLNAGERELKIAMIKSFTTQERTLQPFTATARGEISSGSGI